VLALQQQTSSKPPSTAFLISANSALKLMAGVTFP